MRMRTLLAAGAFFGVVLGSAGLVLKTPENMDRLLGGDGEPTFALAPLSLGHPAAASGLATHRIVHPGLREPGQGGLRPNIFHTTETIGRGETLAGVLARAGVKGPDADAAIRAFTGMYDPRRLLPGQKIKVRFRPPKGSSDGQRTGAQPGLFLGFGFEPDFRHEITVIRHADGRFTAAKEAKKINRSLARVAAQITSSLYLAGQAENLPPNVLAELIRIYSWDVDFQRDIREGDAFEVTYEEVRDEDGRLVHAGTVHFAALTLSGDRRPLYRFVTGEGDVDYFDDKGRGARKALMRTPIDGARLSSGFGKRRHPVLGYTKMHRGVDFAASSGTPIYAAGDGVVTFAGRKGGYGNYINIRHNGRYHTAYAHMKGFARGIGRGKRVRQGQVIGYVGTTGRSTGPHLHYEILVDGGQVNPLSVRMPSGRKLKGEELERFLAAKSQMDLQFARLRDNQDAKNDQDLAEAR
ncbi:MAG: M23 family metallopeptidase [Rhodospirillales bacterium]